MHCNLRAYSDQRSKVYHNCIELGLVAAAAIVITAAVVVNVAAAAAIAAVVIAGGTEVG